MPSKSKNKGSTWERDLAKKLSDIYDDSFIRTPSSGAYTGGKNTIRKQSMNEGQIQGFKGDIIPPDNWKRFNCEAKNYANFPFHHLLQNKDIPLMDGWIAQTLEAADEGDFNIMFIKITRKGTWVAFPTILTNHFNYHAHIIYKDWVITDMDDFMNNNKDKIKYLSINGIQNKSSKNNKEMNAPTISDWD